MLALIAAIMTASLLGSMHCVGMCGPLAIWASGAGESKQRATTMAAVTVYHLGRLVTYLLVGVAAGAIGNLVEASGNILGIQVAAARLAGTIMIVLGILKLIRLRRPARMTHGRGTRIGAALARLRPYVHQLPRYHRALAVGMLTTLLPCGWLYLFAVIAGGTGSMITAPIVMAAFWVGTVPALTGLVAGMAVLSRRVTQAIPAVAAVLLICAGCYTAYGRGFADLRSLSEVSALRAASTIDPVAETVSGESVLTQIRDAAETPLPCCVDEPSEGDPR